MPEVSQTQDVKQQNPLTLPQIGAFVLNITTVHRDVCAGNLDIIFDVLPPMSPKNPASNFLPNPGASCYYSFLCRLLREYSR